MLLKMNRILEKMMPLITPLGVTIGVWCGSLLEPFVFLSPWLFAFITFAGALGSKFKDFILAWTRPLPLFATLVILHIIMPIIAWSMGYIFYPHEPLTATGILLATAIPTGVSSLLWVSMVRGHTSITLSIIMIDTLLAPFIVPWTMSLWVGEIISFDFGHMMLELFGMIVIPTFVGMYLDQLSKGQLKKTSGPWLAPISKIAIGTVVMLNASVISPYVREVNLELLKLVLCIFVLINLGYIAGWAFSKWMKWNPDIVIAVTLNSGMRNISAGSVIALTYFPPPVSLPIICCILFQQTLAALFSKWLPKPS